MAELSILIPANNEMFLARTIQDILENSEADTEVIAVLDSKWAEPAIPQHPRVNIIYVPESIGQRAATNIGVKLSKAHFVAKVDAHCAFDKGFDRKMIEAFEKTGDNVVMVPGMKNLHAFDWKCFKCGKKTYQDTKPICPVDGNEMKRKMLWKPRNGTSQFSYCFDSTPHFQYNGGYRQHPDYIRDLPSGLTESMSIQGSFFMCTREKYNELNLCDEEFGSWGNQGIEVACKMWLSGGRVLINHNTWYAHMFRTKANNGFGFPYPQPGNEIANTKKKVWDLFFNNNWSKQIHPMSWLLEKFWPVPGWVDEDLKKLKA
jgi:glycosyltransferase involved in cell wall biosynthesis